MLQRSTNQQANETMPEGIGLIRNGLPIRHGSPSKYGVTMRPLLPDATIKTPHDRRRQNRSPSATSAAEAVARRWSDDDGSIPQAGMTP